MGWRMIMISVPIASRVRPVSISVSPLATEEVEADILAATPDIYLAASSKLILVRVLFS